MYSIGFQENIISGIDGEDTCQERGDPFPVILITCGMAGEDTCQERGKSLN